MVCKGVAFYNAFWQTPEQAGSLFQPPRQTASNYWHFTHLAPWGWKVRYQVSAPSRNLGAPGLPPQSGPSSYALARALSSLGKSDRDRADGGRISVIHVYHWDPELVTKNPPIPVDRQTYTVPGEGARRVTGAVYTYGFSTVDGVIINLNIKSPAHAARARNPPVPDWQLPAMRSLSDIQYAIWAEAASAQGRINSLEWYFVASILNEQTRQLIRGALQNSGFAQEPPLTPWPGLWISGNTQPGLALLASPLGRTLAYFLIQHKPTLGNMWVDGVVIFHGDVSHRAPCLAFHIRQPGPKPLLPGDPNPNDRNRPWNPAKQPQYIIPDPRNAHRKRQMPDFSQDFNMTEMLRQQEEAETDDTLDTIFV